MLNLIFAPSADTLVPLAEAKIREAWGDPFNPPAIIVPNPAVGKWLSIQLVRSPSFGCVANARMPTLEKFLWETLGGGAGTQMLGADHAAQVICALLNDELLNDEIYRPLKNYLVNRDSGQIDALKRVQLSARIAQQFLEYEYNRPSVWDDKAGGWRKHGIDAKWLAGQKYFDGLGHEAWQSDLYRRACRCFEGEKSVRYTTLPHLYRQRREECAKAKRPWCDVGSNPHIILFGVSKISHFHRNTLVEISQVAGVEMDVFLTNPCAEFWEDVDTRRWNNHSPAKEAGIKPVKPEDYEKKELDLFDLFKQEKDHTLLELWGAAGKENIYLWCPLAEWSFEYHCNDGDSNGDGSSHHDISPNSLLTSIQKSLLQRNNELEIINGSFGGDKSLQILACPDAGREVEEVREQILDLVYEKRVGNFTDIAVYMPDPDRYLPHILRVFGAFPPGHPDCIPFSVLGASSGSSLAARGLFALLGIVSGEFNRARVFELLRNPVVMASKKISPKFVEMWEEWANGHGMFRGYNAEQRKSMGDADGAATEEHTFTRGMERVFEEIGEAGDGLIPPDSVFYDIFKPNTPVSDIRTVAENFRALLDELNELSDEFASVNAAGDRGRPPLRIVDAVEIVRRAIWSWFGTIPLDGSVDSIAETRVRQDALGGLEMIALQNTLAGRSVIERDEFIALVRGCVPEELKIPPSAWHGVTFAPLRSSMALPHRAIFVLGLDATAFPGTNEPVGWNLLESKRIVGDSDKVRDNRFAFLELMHAARERLVLSFRARDMQKDEDLQPSSVVLELEEYLKSQGLASIDEDGAQKCLVRHVIPWVVHESLDAAKKRGRGHGTWDKAQRGLWDIVQRELADARKDGKKYTRKKHRHDLAPPSTKPEASTDTANKNGVDLYDLKKFFENPLEYYLIKNLKIRDDGDDGDMQAVDEPVETGSLLGRLKKNVWIAVLSLIFPDNKNSAALMPDDELTRLAKEKAGKIYEEHIDSGQAPEGHIRRMEKAGLLEWAEKCAAEAKTLTAKFPNHYLIERNSFTLPYEPFDVTVKHALTLVPKDSGDNSLSVGIIAIDKKGNTGGNHALWLDGAAQWLTEIDDGTMRTVILVALNHGGDKPGCKFLTMVPDESKLQKMEEWLTGILTEMLSGTRSEHLPFKAVAEAFKKSKETFEAWVQELKSDHLEKMIASNEYNNQYMKSFALTDARPEKMSDEALRELIILRYAPILGRWIDE